MLKEADALLKANELHFQLVRRSQDIVVEISPDEFYDRTNGSKLPGKCCQFDEATGWPKYSMKEPSGPLSDGIRSIAETEMRGITLRQLLAAWEHVQQHCVAEGWTSTADHKTRLTPKTVTLYDMCHYVIKPATRRRECSFVEFVTPLGEKIVRRCPDGHAPMARTEVYAGEEISCTLCKKPLAKSTAYWLCHRCEGTHLCDGCALAPAPVSCAELQRPLWFTSHW
jgi:hypothetical protein